MTSIETFDVRALWQDRVESATQLASRFRAYLALSKGVLPSDTRWFGWVPPDALFDIENEPEKLTPLIANGLAQHDDGSSWPELGYSCVIPTLRGNPDDRVVSATVRLSAGSIGQNEFKFFSDHDLHASTDPRLVNYEAMRTNLLAIARAFEPEWCEASPLKLGDYFDIGVYNRPPMGLAWMIWFSPPLAALVEPPVYTNTIIERFTDGSLFMATSEEVFDCANTTHLEQARAIHRQIDPLNYTVPFCGTSGRSDRVPPFPQL